jgi:hypothetical protein
VLRGLGLKVVGARLGVDYRVVRRSLVAAFTKSVDDLLATLDAELDPRSP